MYRQAVISLTTDVKKPFVNIKGNSCWVIHHSICGGDREYVDNKTILRIKFEHHEIISCVWAHGGHQIQVAIGSLCSNWYLLFVLFSVWKGKDEEMMIPHLDQGGLVREGPSVRAKNVPGKK